MKLKQKIFYLGLFLFLVAIYYLTSAGNTPYDYFLRLANAFSHGKYYLNDNPPWLSELIPAGNNRYFVVYPPMPTIILAPLVALFKNQFQQQFLAHLLGAGASVWIYLTTLRITQDRTKALYLALLSSLGSIVWFLSSVGSVWYLGQISAFFFLTWSIYESVNRKRFFLLGLLSGATYLSRINLILVVPFVFLLAIDFKKLFTVETFKKILLFTLGLAPFILGNFYYNYIRFGSILENGYFLLPQILKETHAPWFIHGVMSPKYIASNLKTLFWSFPKLISHFPYIIPSWAGLAIWITTPAFLFSLFNFKSNFQNLISTMAIGIILISVSMHGGTGWAQFGYRFAVDFYPFLFLIIANNFQGCKLGRVHWLLLFVSIFVNLWGVLWINKFGWVGF